METSSTTLLHLAPKVISVAAEGYLGQVTFIVWELKTRKPTEGAFSAQVPKVQPLSLGEGEGEIFISGGPLHILYFLWGPGKPGQGLTFFQATEVLSGCLLRTKLAWETLGF